MCIIYCSTYSRQSHNLCTKHFIRSDTLNNAVLEAIKVQIDLVIDIEKVIKEIMKLKKVNYDEEVFGKNLTMLNNELSRYKTLKRRIYEDWKLEVISKEEYLEYSKDYDKNILRLTENIDNIKKQLENANNLIKDNNEWINKFKQNQGITELTKPVLDNLVDNIYICEDERIIVSFKYEDEYKQALEFINDNKVS